MIKTKRVVTAAPEFKKMLDDIRLARIKSGLNKKMLSYKRLTLAISRDPKIKKTLLEANISDAL